MQQRVAILGLGGMGSAASYHLARNGHTVIGLERWKGGHSRSGSAGGLRGFRMAYFQDDAYVALARRAECEWLELSALRSGTFYPTGGALVGPGDHPVMAGVQRSSSKHELGVERLSDAHADECLPGVRRREGEVALWEPRAGLLHALACDRAHREGATEAGATLIEGCTIHEVDPSGGDVRVRTDAGTFAVDWVIVSPGVWLADMGFRLPQLPIMRQIQADFEADGRWQRGLWNLAPGDVRHSFYGATRGDGAVTVGQHLGGAIRRTYEAPNPEEQARIKTFVHERMTGVGALLRWRVGHSIHTPDQAPLIGPHPDHPNVLLSAGFSGHGYKFASAVGWHLARWVGGMQDDEALRSFRPDRLSFEPQVTP